MSSNLEYHLHHYKLSQLSHLHPLGGNASPSILSPSANTRHRREEKCFQCFNSRRVFIIASDSPPRDSALRDEKFRVRLLRRQPPTRTAKKQSQSFHRDSRASLMMLVEDCSRNVDDVGLTMRINDDVDLEKFQRVCEGDGR